MLTQFNNHIKLLFSYVLCSLSITPILHGSEEYADRRRNYSTRSYLQSQSKFPKRYQTSRNEGLQNNSYYRRTTYNDRQYKNYPNKPRWNSCHHLRYQPSESDKNESSLPPVNVNRQLYNAVCKGDIKLMTSFLKSDSSVNPTTLFDGETALHIMARRNTVQAAVKLCESKNIDVNLQDEQGNTPLHITSSIFIVKALIQKGANPLIKNKLGKDVLTTVREKRLPSIIGIIQTTADHIRAETSAEERKMEKKEALKKTSPQGLCPICMDEITIENKGYKPYSCDHELHLECSQELFKAQNGDYASNWKSYFQNRYLNNCSLCLAQLRSLKSEPITNLLEGNQTELGAQEAPEESEMVSDAQHAQLTEFSSSPLFDEGL